MPRETLWLDTLHDHTIASGGVLVARLISGTTGAMQRRLMGATIVRVILCHEYSYEVHDSGEGTQRYSTRTSIPG